MVSLLEALEHAGEYETVTGTTAGEAVALIEFLLAVLYSGDDAPSSMKAWSKDVADRRGFEQSAAWLRSQPDEQWNLFDPQLPLGQNALLAPFLREHGVGTAQLVPERAGDYNLFYDHIHLHHSEPVPADAAFRSMLAQHAYGLYGRAMVATTLLGPRLTNLATGRLAGRVRVLACGRTLLDLLRLNIAPLTADPGVLNTSWTSGPVRREFRSDKTTRMPAGPADLHSFLGRSILLHPVHRPDGGLAVDRVIVAAGELLESDLPGLYRQDEVLIERGSGELVTLTALKDVALWREVHALYAATLDHEKGGDLYHRIADLAGRPDWSIGLWAVGLIANKTVPVDWVDDRFPFVPGRERDLSHAAKHGAAICSFAAGSLYQAAALTRGLVFPQGKPADKEQQIAQFNGAPDLWAQAAALFHRLLDQVAVDLDADTALAEFGERVYRLAERVLGNRLAALPRNGTGYRARAEAHRRLFEATRAPKAPHFYGPRQAA